MKFKNTFITGLALSTTMLSCLALADTYQAEIGASASRIDFDGVNSKANAYSLTGAYYFDAVNTTGKPLAESAYLGKNSSVFAQYSDINGNKNFQDSQFYMLGGALFIPESFLYVGAGVIRSTYESESRYSKNDWFASVGITPIDGLLISTQYNHDAGYDANLSAKYVTSVGGHFINLEAGLYDTDSGIDKRIGGDFYLDPTFSVGGSINKINGDDYYEVRTRKFFTENFSGNLSYTDMPLGRTVMAGVNVRF